MSFPTIDFRLSRSVFKRALRYGTKLARRIAPRGFNVNAPICQLFLSGFGKSTVYTFTNFPSLYSPRTASACQYDLVLYNEAGARTATGRITVPRFATRAVRLEDVMDGALPALGVLTARIRPHAPLSYADRHLGTITSHFYALYEDSGMRALSVVHPQTTLWDDVPPRLPWRSNLVILPDLIDGVELFQINPGARAVDSTLSVCQLDGTPVLSAPGRIAPRGARRISWDRRELGSHRYVVIAADTLAAPNAKPLLFQHYQGRYFSAAHC